MLIVYIKTLYFLYWFATSWSTFAKSLDSNCEILAGEDDN